MRVFENGSFLSLLFQRNGHIRLNACRQVHCAKLMPLSVRLSKSFGFSLSKSSFYMKHLTAKCAYVHCFLHRIMCINFGIFRVLEVVYYLIFHVYLFLVLIWTSLPISIVLFVHMKCPFSMVIFGFFFLSYGLRELLELVRWRLAQHNQHIISYTRHYLRTTKNGTHLHIHTIYPMPI